MDFFVSLRRNPHEYLFLDRLFIILRFWDTRYRVMKALLPNWVTVHKAATVYT